MAKKKKPDSVSKLAAIEAENARLHAALAETRLAISKNRAAKISIRLKARRECAATIAHALAETPAPLVAGAYTVQVVSTADRQTILVAVRQRETG